MVRIYFDKKTMTIDSADRGYNPETVVRLHGGEEATNLLNFPEHSKSVLFLSDDPDAAFEALCRGMRCITAAGGLTTRPDGGVLMIFRHGKWDLPKGKLEDYERIDSCALREIEEECGIGGVVCGGFLTNTHHIYRLHGSPVLKTTYWYRTRYNGGDAPRPQTAEGIERVEWVAPERIPRLLENTYPNIRDVFRVAGYI